jgi:hypothetical protein
LHPDLAALIDPARVMLLATGRLKKIAWMLPGLGFGHAMVWIVATEHAGA